MHNNTMISIARRVHGVSVPQLSSIMGLSIGSTYDLEIADSDVRMLPSLDQFFRLCRALKLRPIDFNMGKHGKLPGMVVSLHEFDEYLKNWIAAQNTPLEDLGNRVGWKMPINLSTTELLKTLNIDAFMDIMFAIGCGGAKTLDAWYETWKSDARLSG